MELVIVEGRYLEPTSPEAVVAGDFAQRWCFDHYHSHPVTHFLSPDGTRICCIFQAPDAEAVRRALASLDVVAPDRVWTASLHAPAPPDRGPPSMAELRAAAGSSVVLVERSFAAPVAFAEVQALEDAGAWCLRLNEVRFLATFFARDRRRMVCLYRAPDAEAVRRTNNRLGLPFDEVWTASVFAAA